MPVFFKCQCPKKLKSTSEENKKLTFSKKTIYSSLSFVRYFYPIKYHIGLLTMTCLFLR